MNTKRSALLHVMYRVAKIHVKLYVMARLWFVHKSLVFWGEDSDQVQVSSFYCFTLFTERLIDIADRNTEIKNINKLARKKSNI